ncbi:MAG: ParA family protein [Kineosporiaceae bacterium]|jgi:chromosome partitioning protein
MGRIIAVANQKGGVAKTTTVVSLGAAFAEHGLRVLLVDLDPQAGLTFSLGLDPDEPAIGLHDVLLGRVGIASAVTVTGTGPEVLPAALELAAAEAELLVVPSRERVLHRALAPVAGDYEVILLDCPPSLGMLTLNALAAADEVLIPLQCEMLGHRGVGQLLDTVADVRAAVNERLLVRGILPTMFDARTMHARAVLADVGERFEVPVLSPPVPRSVRFAEAPALGRPVLRTATRSAGARAYRELALGLLRAWGIGPGRRPTRRRAG